MGFGFLIAVLAGMVVYQYFTISHMRDINETLGNVSFQNTLACLGAWNDLTSVDIYTKKSFVDPEFFSDSLRESKEDFGLRLEELESYAKSVKEKAEVARLSDQWISFERHFNALKPQVPQGGAEFPDVLQDDLFQLKTQISSMFYASQASMKLTAQESTRTAKAALRVSLGATFGALAISILISYLIFRSISKPLASLTEGTRAIAEGRFLYRLDTSRKDEFSQLAKDFNTMTRRLNELDVLKKDFVSHVSHELKSPLASMQETIRLLLDQIPGPLTEKQKRLLELNLQSGGRLTSMIGNLLDLSKMEAGVMEYELKCQDLLPLVQGAVAELEVQAEERQIEIRTAFPEGSLLVECDSDHIVQVIVNLVDNAIKFSPKKGVVQIAVEMIHGVPERTPNRWRRLIGSLDRGGDFGLVTISDAGPGIPDSDKETVFEKFHQIKQGKRIAGQGVGLGLAICRTIIEAHRGAIWAEDNPGGGSRFHLLLRSGEEGKMV